MILFGIPVFIRVFVIVPFPMSMFCKFRHRGKSNVFIVISVGARECMVYGILVCCNFGFIVCRENIGSVILCSVCFHYVSMIGFDCVCEFGLE